MELRKEVIDIFNDNKWRLICYKFCKDRIDLADDLYQEWALVIMEEKAHKIDDLIQKDLLELYAYRVLRNLWHSSTSQFYYKYRKVNSLDISRYIDINTDDRSREQVLLYNELMDAFNNAYNEAKLDGKVYEMMTRIYVDVGSFRKMQEELGINHMTCNRYVNRFRDIVKGCYNKLPMANDTDT